MSPAVDDAGPLARAGRGAQRQLAAYPVALAACRAFRRHDWQPWSIRRGVTYGGLKRRYWWRRELYCHCGTRKTEIFDSLGRLVWRTYVHPDGYRLAALDLPEWQVMGELRLLMFGRELAAETIREEAEQAAEQRAKR